MKSLLDNIKKGEGLHQDFKYSFQKEVIESIVANASGDNVFIGVDDFGDIVFMILNTILLKKRPKKQFYLY